MKKILVIDGGGAKGLIPSVVLEHIERNLKKPIYEVFDLIIGSSIGSYIGGVMASGRVPASTFREILYNELPIIFKRRWRVPFLQPKYGREHIRKIIGAYTDGMKMSDCRTKFMCTSVNMCDAKTHFFKSWEKKDGQLLIIDTLLRSSAAPLYFGFMVDKKTKSVWMDGGTGNMNSPIMEALIESMVQDWFRKEDIHVLSIGCGQKKYSVSFDKAVKFKNPGQVWFYGDIIEGGLARVQASETQIYYLKKFEKYESGFTFQRIDKNNMPKNIDKMDGVKYRDDYVAIGEELADSVDYKYLG